MQEPNVTELLRRLDNLFRLGTIAEVDHNKALVKVQSGNITTDWLPWLTLRAGTTKTWSPPTVGEQCIVFAVSGELTTGIVMVGLYTQNAPSNSPDHHVIEFADGCTISYDQAAGSLVVTNCKTAVIKASESITAESPIFTHSQDVQINGKLSVTGDINTQSNVTAKGEVSGKGKKLSTHTHTGVEAGNKQSGEPA